MVYRGRRSLRPLLPYIHLCGQVSDRKFISFLVLYLVVYSRVEDVPLVEIMYLVLPDMAGTVDNFRWRLGSMWLCPLLCVCDVSRAVLTPFVESFPGR